jgi:hypothetical protein
VYYYLHRFTAEDNERALELASSAVSASPNLATWTAYFNVYEQRLEEGWWEEPTEVLRGIDRAARGACEVQRGGWACHIFSAWSAFWSGSPEKVVPLLKLSLDASGGLPIVQAQLGQAQAIIGDPEKGLATIDGAIERVPNDASMSWMLLCRAQALFARADYAGARDAATRSLTTWTGLAHFDSTTSGTTSSVGTSLEVCLSRSQAAT